MGGKAGFCPNSPAVFPPEIELVRGMRLLPNAFIIFFASSLTCCFLFEVLVFLFDVRRFTLATKLLLLYVPFYCTIAGSGAATRALRNWGRGRRQRHRRFQIRKLVLYLRCLAFLCNACPLSVLCSTALSVRLRLIPWLPLRDDERPENNPVDCFQ